MYNKGDKVKLMRCMMINKDWSALNALLQKQFKKEITYKEGITTLLALRKELMDTVESFKKELNREDFDAMPFMNARGYHNKTIAYSLWHVFRIEDIVVHSIINDEEQIFFSKEYNKRIGASILTTGNELVKEQIQAFSKELNLDELYAYMHDVKESSEDLIKALSYKDIKRKMAEDKKDYVYELDVVSTCEDAIWLVEYWCNKDVKGLLQMPLSRHWIMHVQACLRIKEKLHKKVD